MIKPIALLLAMSVTSGGAAAAAKLTPKAEAPGITAEQTYERDSRTEMQSDYRLADGRGDEVTRPVPRPMPAPAPRMENSDARRYESQAERTDTTSGTRNATQNTVMNNRTPDTQTNDTAVRKQTARRNRRTDRTHNITDNTGNATQTTNTARGRMSGIEENDADSRYLAAMETLKNKYARMFDIKAELDEQAKETEAKWQEYWALQQSYHKSMQHVVRRWSMDKNAELYNEYNTVQPTTPDTRGNIAQNGDNTITFDNTVRNDVRTPDNTIQNDVRTPNNTIRNDVRTLDNTVRNDVRTLDNTVQNDVRYLDNNVRHDVRSNQNIPMQPANNTTNNTTNNAVNNTANSTANNTVNDTATVNNANNANTAVNDTVNNANYKIQEVRPFAG